jgi:hydrogenase/urease accessory protein HupE
MRWCNLNHKYQFAIGMNHPAFHYQSRSLIISIGIEEIWTATSHSPLLGNKDEPQPL